MNTSITYLMPRASGVPQDVLHRVYLIVDRPKISGAESQSKSGHLKQENLPVDLDIDRLAAEVRRMLQARGGRLVGYRLATPADPFLPFIAPTSVLQVKLLTPTLSEARDDTVREEKVNGEWVKKLVPRWSVQGALTVETRLTGYPDNTLWGETRETLKESKTYDKEAGNELHERYQKIAEALVLRCAKGPVQSALPLQFVKRERPLYPVDGDKISKTHCADAARNKWEKAVTYWKDQQSAGSTAWQHAWNLGVWAESRYEPKEARPWYEKARAASANAPKPPKMNWESLWSDLGTVFSAAPENDGRAARWFSQKVAVLPFTDVSTSVDGPVFVRRLTEAKLRASGYSTIPLETVDQVLRDHGFTQGGQLRAASPEDIAAWLSADLLLYGHLDQFDEFTLGIFGWKRMNGTFRLWSREEKKDLWMSDKSVSRVSHVSGKKAADIGWSFLHQLVSSWSDKVSSTPMSEESAYFVSEHLIELPQRVK